MNDNEEIILEGVEEYTEHAPVLLKRNFKHDLCVVAYTEAGYSETWVNAEQLFDALKEYFEGNQVK